MRVGFIGIGRMGYPMARNLIKAGHQVIAYNRTRSRAEALKDDGASIADTPADACKGDVVITMLADDSAVEQIVFGDKGLFSALTPATVHLSMGTISIALSERLKEAHLKAGCPYVAATVFGRPDAAADAKLFIIAAGPERYVSKCQPLFEVMGQKTFIVGQNQPSANVVKLSGNFLIASVIESLGEAFALIRKYGVDSEQFLEILIGTLFSAPIYKTYGGIIAQEKYEPAGFKLHLGLKDIRLALAAAEGLAVPMPTASLIRDNFLTAIANGHSELDWAALALICAENAGLKRERGNE